MTQKRAVIALIAALLAFGYLFTLNPGMVEFRIYPGQSVNTSFALILFLFLLAGMGVAVFATAFTDAVRSFHLWRRRKADERRDDAKRLLVKGRAEATLGKTREARRLMQRAYRKASGEKLVVLEMARVEIADGRLGEAERRLKALLGDDPHDPEVLSLLLDVYRKRGDNEGQLAALSRWLEVEPNHQEALENLRDVYRETRNWTEAGRVQEKILTLPGGRAARGRERRLLSEIRLREARSQGAAAARRTLEGVIRGDESFAPAHAALGEILRADRDPDGAVEAWVRGYHATGRAALLLMAEEVRCEQGKAEEMLRLYKKLGKKGGVPALLRARLLLALERSKEALDLLEGDTGERTRAGHLLLGEALYRLRSCDEAVRAMREGVFAGREELPLAYSCRACGRTSGEWAPVCPACDAVDTLELDLQCVAPAPAPVPAGKG